jgi:hypothetical protein
MSALWFWAQCDCSGFAALQTALTSKCGRFWLFGSRFDLPGGNVDHQRDGLVEVAEAFRELRHDFQAVSRLILSSAIARLHKPQAATSLREL